MYYKIVILLSLFLFSMYSCNSKVVVSKPSSIPKDVYYDNDNFLLVRFPAWIDNAKERYLKWEKNNPTKSVFSSYKDIFKINSSKSEQTSQPIQPPALRKKPSPKIPQIAANSDISKVVWIKIMIDETGDIVAAQLWDIVEYSASNAKNLKTNFDISYPWKTKKINEVEKVLIREALIAAINMKFTPAKQGPNNIMVSILAPFVFDI